MGIFIITVSYRLQWGIKNDRELKEGFIEKFMSLFSTRESAVKEDL